MDQNRLATIIGVGMVGLGLTEAVHGIRQDDVVFAILGLSFAAFGVVYLRNQTPLNWE